MEFHSPRGSRVPLSLLVAVSYPKDVYVLRTVDGKRKDVSEEAEKTLFRYRNAVNAHVWAQGFWDKNRPISLLIVLDYCDPCPACRQS